MKNRYLLFTISLIIGMTFLNCESNNFDPQLLVGSWEVSSWEIDETDKAIDQMMDMTFNEDGSYLVDYGSEQENGKYWIAGKYLHTVEKGQAEKKVKLVELVVDSMRFQMNRGGRLESVLLLKKNND